MKILYFYGYTGYCFCRISGQHQYSGQNSPCYGTCSTGTDLRAGEAPVRIEEEEVGLLVAGRHQVVAVRLVRNALVTQDLSTTNQALCLCCMTSDQSREEENILLIIRTYKRKLQEFDF